MSIDQIKDAIESGGTGDDLAGLTIPETYRAAHTLRSEQEMFADMASADKDPRTSLHVGQVATPELARDEVVVAVMASAQRAGIGDDTVSWTMPAAVAGSVYRVRVAAPGARPIEYEVRPTGCGGR